MEREFDLYYYDGLANQQEEIRLTISKKLDDIGCNRNLCSVHSGSGDQVGSSGQANDLIPPIEHCIRTRYGITSEGTL